MFTPGQRQDYIARYGRSGLSQAEFCRRAKLHPVTFSQWRRTVKPAAPPAFAEVQVSAPLSVATGTVAVLHLCDGARLEVSVGSEAAWHGLGRLLQSLQS